MKRSVWRNAPERTQPMAIITHAKRKLKVKNRKKRDGDPRFSLRYFRKNFGSLESSKNKFNNSDFKPLNEERNYVRITPPYKIQKVKDEFKEYTQRLKKKAILLSDYEDPEQGYVIFPWYASRYSSQGQKKVARKIRSWYGYNVEYGVFLTLTFDPKEYTLLEAWQNLRQLIKKTMNKIKIYAIREKKKRGAEKPKIEYLWVIEIHKNGYPHVHIFYPLLARLMDIEKIKKIWNVGHVWVERKRNIWLGSYMSKYLSKGQGLEDGLPFLWKFRIRLYGASNLERVKRKEKTKGRYIYVGSANLKYSASEPNTPDLETLALNNGIRRIAFFGGGGMSVKWDLMDEKPEEEWFRKIFIVGRASNANGIFSSD